MIMDGILECIALVLLRCSEGGSTRGHKKSFFAFFISALIDRDLLNFSLY